MNNPNKPSTVFNITLFVILGILGSFTGSCTTGTNRADRIDQAAAIGSENLANRDKDLIEKFARIPDRVIPDKVSYEYERFYFHWHPITLQDPNTGRILVDLTIVKKQIIPELSALGILVDQMELEADGGTQLGGATFPIDLNLLKQTNPYMIYDGGPVHQMHYCRVVLKSKGKEVHVTDNGYIERLNFPKLNPDAYGTFSEPEMTLPSYIQERRGVDPALVRRSAVLQHKNVVWTVAENTQNLALKEAFQKYGSELQPRPLRDVQGTWTGWEIALPPDSHVIIRAELKDILTKGGAAFNQHSYFWDDHFVAEARASSDPKIAIDTLKYWIDSQRPDGGIARELDFKGKPFQRPDFVKYGKIEPNRDFFNPPIAGWAWHEVYSWNPKQSLEYLPRVISMMRAQREWLKKNHGVFDRSGNLIGLKWSNEGSGRDNSPRPLDEYGLAALPKYGQKIKSASGRDQRGLAVDLLAQYKMLIDYEHEFSEILGRFADADRAAIEADKIKKLLNSRYFNQKLGWYVDLVPSGKSAWAQTNIITLAGFWPVAAKAPTRERVAKIIKEYLENPNKFGGLFPPSVPRDNPYYDEGGHYWKGGGWPSDWEMVSRALREYGFRAEAALLTEREMAAISVASKGYVKGDSPQFMVDWVDAKTGSGTEAEYQATRARVDEYFRQFWSGQIHNPRATDPAGTVFEFYGLRRDPINGNPIATYGHSIRAEDNLVHRTRTDFAGWGAVVPLRSAHYLFGLDVVPRPAAENTDVDRWLFKILRDPLLNYHQVRNVPAFKKLAKFLLSHPQSTMIEFRRVLQREKSANKDLQQQIALLQKGYIEVSLSFDPTETGAAIKNFIYDGTRFDISFSRNKNGDLEVQVNSPGELRIQLNRNWQGDGAQSSAIDRASASSPILEISGSHRTIILPRF